MVRAHIAIAVRRLATAGVVMSFEGKQRSWHRGRRLPNVLKQRLDVWKTGGWGWWRSFWERFWGGGAVKGVVFLLGFWWGPGKGSQIPILKKRGDQLPPLRTLGARGGLGG